MNPLYFKRIGVAKLFDPESLSCASCDCGDDDRQTLFEYPLKSDEWWCATCFEQYHHLTWNPKTRRWNKTRCECHNQIEIYLDDGNSSWVCPVTKEVKV
jgi:hypothetical protein